MGTATESAGGLVELICSARPPMVSIAAMVPGFFVVTSGSIGATEDEAAAFEALPEDRQAEITTSIRFARHFLDSLPAAGVQPWMTLRRARN